MRTSVRFAAKMTLCILVVLSLPAVAHGASFTASAANLTVTGLQSGPIMHIGSSELSCKKVIYTGKTPANQFTSLTLTPSFSECTYSLFKATVTGFGPGGCDQIFNADGHFDLICPPGQLITIDAGPCLVTIPGQYNRETITYWNNFWNHLDAEMNVSKIMHQVHDGFLCPYTGVNTELNEYGYYTGTVSLNDGEAQLSWDK